MPTKFVFILLPQLHLLDLAGPDQVIHEAIGFNANFQIDYCCLEKSIQSSAGLPFKNVQHFSKVKFSKGDYLIVPGANTSYLTSTEFKTNKNFFNWIKLNYENGVNICSICVGAFVLAESGVLKDVACTTHFKKTADLQKHYPTLNVLENRLFTDENGIYTSAGILAGIDLMLHIVEKLKGSYFAHLVAREMVMYSRRNGVATQLSPLLQFRSHIHAGIHIVQDYIVEHIQQKNALGYLAEIANMSERNFTRIFKKETGVTVKQFTNLMRNQKAKELITNPDLSKIAIANKLGLSSEKQLNRILNATA